MKGKTTCGIKWIEKEGEKTQPAEDRKGQMPVTTWVKGLKGAKC